MLHCRKATLAVLLGLLPTTVSAQNVKVVRKVELISMGAVSQPGEESAVPSAEDAGSAALQSDAFRVHDLSRRYVEYRMAQEFAPVAAPVTGGSEPTAAFVPIAPVSSIAVPGWMKGTYPTLASTTYKPGCVPLPYSQTTFLRPDAEKRRASYYGMMSAIACEHGLPVGLFDAMIIQESRYNVGAISPKGAFGFAQLMPGTARDLGVNAYDPAQNLRGGARYLRRQLDRFGQVHLALAAYNAGPSRIRNGAVPRIAETQNYVATIMGNWVRLSGSTVSQQTLVYRRPSNPRMASVSTF